MNNTEEYDESTNKNGETKTDKIEKNEKIEDSIHSTTIQKSTVSINAGGSRQISSISLKMVSDCVDLVVDQSHIQLSSIIHISKKDNQLNIEHKMMENNSSTARESSSDSTEENIINRNSFYTNATACCSSRNEQLNVIVHQPSCSNQQSKLNIPSLNTAGTSSASPENRSNLNGVNNTENSFKTHPPPYTKSPGHNHQKRQTTRQLLNQLYNGVGSNFQFGPHLQILPLEIPTTHNQNVSACPRVFHHGVLGIPPLHGAPPTYSAVMRIGPRLNQASEQLGQPHTNSRLFNSLFKRPEMCLQPSAPFIAPPRPPPTYAEVQGVSVMRTPIELSEIDQDIHWGPTPLSVHCPNCGNIVMTVVRLRRSNLTHFSALTLCLCGCWPCVLLPYCMKTCKTSYHECPICFTVIGMFTPW